FYSIRIWWFFVFLNQSIFGRTVYSRTVYNRVHLYPFDLRDSEAQRARNPEARDGNCQRGLKDAPHFPTARGEVDLLPTRAKASAVYPQPAVVSRAPSRSNADRPR